MAEVGQRWSGIEPFRVVAVLKRAGEAAGARSRYIVSGGWSAGFFHRATLCRSRGRRFWQLPVSVRMRNLAACTFILCCWAMPLWLCCLVSAQVIAEPACNPQPDAQYESAFCRVKQSRYGDNLPSLNDFRRNPQNMQYLLLRRLANKLDIDLSPPQKSKAVQAARKTAARTATPQRDKRSVAPSPGASCSTSVDSIRCGSRVFRRLSNRSNKNLRPEALGASNRLLFSPPGVAGDEDRYLLEAYVLYLNKMISIGLAGSTFSYSGFAHTYYEHQRSGTDFVERFRAMFEFLKQDKKKIAVSRRSPGRRPDWQECEPLNSELIACNSQGMNLLYQASR